MGVTRKQLQYFNLNKLNENEKIVTSLFVFSRSERVWGELIITNKHLVFFCKTTFIERLNIIEFSDILTVNYSKTFGSIEIIISVGSKELKFKVKPKEVTRSENFYEVLNQAKNGNFKKSDADILLSNNAPNINNNDWLFLKGFLHWISILILSMFLVSAYLSNSWGYFIILFSSILVLLKPVRAYINKKINNIAFIKNMNANREVNNINVENTSSSKKIFMSLIMVLIILIFFVEITESMKNKSRQEKQPQQQIIAKEASQRQKEKVKEEKDRKIADFALKRQSIIDKIKKSISKKQYLVAMLSAEKYNYASDPEIKELHTRAVNGLHEERVNKFKSVRKQLLATMKKFIKQGNYQDAVDAASAYFNVKDKAFQDLYREAKKGANKENIAEAQRRSRFEDIKKDKNFAFIFCKNNVVMQSLKSPNSADFPWADFTASINRNSNIITIGSYVDAQNEFGAMIRANYTCKLKYNGGGIDGWIVDSFQFNQ